MEKLFSTLHPGEFPKSILNTSFFYLGCGIKFIIYELNLGDLGLRYYYLSIYRLLESKIQMLI